MKIYLTQAETRRLEILEKRYRNAARKQIENRVAFYHKYTVDYHQRPENALGKLFFHRNTVVQLSSDFRSSQGP